MSCITNCRECRSDKRLLCCFKRFNLNALTWDKRNSLLLFFFKKAFLLIAIKTPLILHNKAQNTELSTL